MIALVTAAVTVWLWREAGSSAQLRIDAVRTGFTVGFGAGGALALVLAARRQWLQERNQEHHERTVRANQEHLERVASATERDALLRRVTELYSKSLDQLGSERATVRLGGIYALERLAAENSSQRQMIANVICAYLRMPFQYSVESAPDFEELAVRLAAQRVLEKNLYAGGAVGAASPPKDFWEGIDIDLSGATLVDFHLVHCNVARASFDGAHFFGLRALFTGTAFKEAWFQGTTFHCAAFLEDAVVTSSLFLNLARFEETFCFNRSRVHGGTWAKSAEFQENAYFVDASFGGVADFTDMHFRGNVSFGGASFLNDGRFQGTSFRGAAVFDDVDHNMLENLVVDNVNGSKWFDDPLLARAPRRP